MVNVKTQKKCQKEKVEVEVQNPRLQYHNPPTFKDSNCIFHATSDQLAHLGFTLKTTSEPCSSVIQYLKNNLLTPDRTHLREFNSYQAWESYLHRMS